MDMATLWLNRPSGADLVKIIVVFEQLLHYLSKVYKKIKDVTYFFKQQLKAVLHKGIALHGLKLDPLQEESRVVHWTQI